MRLHSILTVLLFLLVSEAASAASRYLDTRWTKAAAAASATGKTEKKALPELRIFNGQGRLIYRGFGAKAGTMAATVDRAIQAQRPTKGPSFAETMNELETRDGKPALPQALGKGKVTIVDYWADWCLPCKILSKELDAWAGRQTPGAVQIVRAETDPMAAARANGEKVYLMKKGPDGKWIKTEMK